MNKHQFNTNKTARYFTLGKLNKNTTKVYFALHGYAQTAEDFLETLNPLLEENTFIIAPEGLSRFYWKDFTTNPVASWMTKTDREIDIHDNLNYLENLYDLLFEDVDISNIKFNCLGFSQGAATISRWVFHTKMNVKNIFFYAGSIGTELDYQKSIQYQNANINFIYGSKDFFIKASQVEEIKSFFERNNLEIDIFTFEGKHIIHQDALQYIQNKQTK